MSDPFRRLKLGVALFGVVLAIGSVGYVLLGLPVLDALYQTVTTVTTVGFREVEPLSAAGKVFTMVLIIGGVGTALYTFGMLLEAIVEGQFSSLVWRRRMDRDIDTLRDHVIVCGWGRVGRAIARHVIGSGHQVVIVDQNLERLTDLDVPYVHGDATDDGVLARAGIERARALAAALDTDADNLFVTLSTRALRPDLVIIARARTESSEPKLARAGANRVVNPQLLGGQRMASFALQPHVADFLDVVMHDGSLQFRVEELRVAAGSSIADRSIRDAHIRDRTGALVLALRDASGRFTTNPTPETVIVPGDILIAIGTSEQLALLTAEAATGSDAATGAGPVETS